MEQAISQETVSDPGHSSVSEGNESNASGNSLKSAAMLGIALSVGASGALTHQAEASAAVSAPAASAETKAFSSDSKVSATKAAEGELPSQQRVADYHTVESGESLWQIAQQHGVGLRDLKSANALPPETSIRVGQVLKVPEGAQSPVNVSVATSNAAQLIAGITAEESADNITTAEALELEAPAVAEPDGLAQAVSASNDLQVSNTSEVAKTDAAAPVASIAIEIAELPQEEPAQPVVTALAAPASLDSYQVRAGDTLVSIASSLGTTPEELVRTNAISNPNVIIAGATLRVPASSSLPSAPTLAKKADSASENIAANQQLQNRERLAYLRSTASQPGSARILEGLRSASPEEALSIGGEQATEQDLITTNPETGESIDPYVANLMAEVQEIRNQSVRASEAEITEIEADETLIARSEQVGVRPNLLSRGTEQSTNVARSTAARPEVNSDLLAAAPLSPDAYVPAQRSSAGQVVTPDMPILPSADEYLPEAPNHFDGYIWPTQGTVTSGYGWRWGRMHRGVDVAGPVGTPIVAAASGVVEQAGWNSGGYGNLVEIRHPDGSLTRYAHNNSLNVSAGQSVRQGQQIAEMGSTGYSTGPHLHFEVHQGGGAVNPVAYLPNR
ncbi:MAG: peptidoglycan DD-metalloendopeptidase family protein [Cyanobacteria bacterium P01_A01_bin.116]